MKSEDVLCSQHSRLSLIDVDKKIVYEKSNSNISGVLDFRFLRE